MKRIACVLAGLTILCASAPAQAQQQTVVAPGRSVAWTSPGAVNGPQTRTTNCATLNPGATASQINSAIASCPAGQVVKLNAGTFNLGSGIDFNGKDNVTLRGAGPDQTKLVFSGNTGCLGLGADICVRGTDGWWTGGVHFSANWTGGYSKGGTSLTFSNTTGLTVGTMILLDQLNDSNTDTGQIWVCTADNICVDEGGGAFARANRAQQQIVRVTGISGSTVTVTPGIYMPNWRASQAPGAMWGSDVITGVGVEDLFLDNTNANSNGVEFFAAMDSWLKNVSSYKSARAHVLFYQSAHITIRDSYFEENLNHQSQCYGIESFISSDNLIENNIFRHVTAPLMVNGTASGSVFGYNYSTDDTYTVSAGWMIPSVTLHEGGIDSLLFEGNEGPGFGSDAIHGTHHFVTVFRNYYTGLEPGKNAQTNPVKIYAFGRYFNLVGNVFGTQGYHNTYEFNVSGANEETSIYSLGSDMNTSPSDSLVKPTLMRWGNYDTVTGTSRFVASEVPSGLSLYANPVPSTNTLPASFYLAGKPAWFGVTAWPPIGPDVTGGTGPGGHAYKIPAHKCFDATPIVNSVLVFNAGNCYAASGPAPTAPTNLRIIGG